MLCRYANIVHAISLTSGAPVEVSGYTAQVENAKLSRVTKVVLWYGLCGTIYKYYIIIFIYYPPDKWVKGVHWL